MSTVRHPIVDSRLLARHSGRVIGLGHLGVALVLLLAGEPIARLSEALPAAFALGAALLGYVVQVQTPRLPWLALIAAGVVAAILVLPESDPLGGASQALTLVATGGGAALALVAVGTRGRLRWVIVGLALAGTVAALMARPGLPMNESGFLAVVALAAWAVCTATAWWWTASDRHARNTFGLLAQALAATRRAEAVSADQVARASTTHDGLLSTLALLAHRGVGVGPEALRELAENDARAIRAGQTVLRPGSPRRGVTRHPAGTSDRSGGGRGGEQDTRPPAAVLPAHGAALRLRGYWSTRSIDVGWHGASELELEPGKEDAVLEVIASLVDASGPEAGRVDIVVGASESAGHTVVIATLPRRSGAGGAPDPIEVALLPLAGIAGASWTSYRGETMETTVVISVPKP